MGMACQCPQCGITFLIPTAPQPAAAAAVEPEANWAVEDFTQPPADAVEQFAEQLSEPAPSAPPPSPDAEKPAVLEMLAEEPPDKTGGVESLGALEIAAFHIPCPNGHVLEAPQEMIGHFVICPYCSVQFKLRRENSSEYQQRQEFLDRARAQFWFKWTIIIGVMVGLGLLVMIIMSLFMS
jgi:hypothetical protein